MATATARKSKAKAKPRKPRKPRGRPPLIHSEITLAEMDPETGEARKRKVRRSDAIVEALRRGLYVEDAAALVGIHRSTAFDWLARGEEWLAVEDEKIPDAERPYADFAVAVETARSEAVEVALGSIRRAADEGQWQAAAWFLERTRPGRYSRMERREISGADGGPITLLDLEREVAEEAIE